MIYLITDGQSRIKIGKSKNPSRRLKQIQTGNALKLHLIGCFDLPDSYERRLHGILQQFKTKGEWFDFPDISWLLEYLSNLELDYKSNNFTNFTQ